MADVTVAQFAEVLKVPVDRLLQQLDQAGIKVGGPDDRISDEAKLELLTHLRKSHGADEQVGGSPNKITLKRKRRLIPRRGPARRERTGSIVTAAAERCSGKAQHSHDASRSMSRVRLRADH